MTESIKQEIAELIEPKITKIVLVTQIERLVRNEGLSYIEATIAICDENSIDPEEIAKIITGSLKDKIEIEARRNNFLPKSTTATLFG